MLVLIPNPEYEKAQYEMVFLDKKGNRLPNIIPPPRYVNAEDFYLGQSCIASHIFVEQEEP